MFPNREIAIGVQRALQLVIGRRPVEPVLHVILASPENHDGLARSLCGYLRRFHDEIGLVTAAKTATHQRGIHDDPFGGPLTGFGDYPFRPLWRLASPPPFRTVGPTCHDALHPLTASFPR